MKKILFCVSVLLCTSIIGENTTTVQDKNIYVYICMGQSSYRYHKKTNCRGLENCSTQLKKITVSEAKTKYKRTPCKLCYR